MKIQGLLLQRRPKSNKKKFMDNEENENSLSEPKRMITRMTEEMKKDIQKHINKIKVDVSKQELN
jgi:hypothetical protein